MSDFFKTFIKNAGNEAAIVLEDMPDMGEPIDTGSYVLNALLSGSIYGGMAGNKITVLAGEPSTGKTFYALSIAKSFLDTHENSNVIYFETEKAIEKDDLIKRGIDSKRLFILPVITVQEFRTQALRIIDGILKTPEKERPKVLIILDSIGMLSTEKEMTDIADGKDTRDMTRAQLLRGTFRVLTNKLGTANVPLLCTNHTYDVVGAYVPTKKQGGGSGSTYSASAVLFLSKKAEKDGSDVVGAIITAKLEKSRLTIEKKKVETLLRFDSGLDKYYGLLELAEKFDIVKKVSTKYEFPDGSKHFESHINKKPEKFWTKEILDKIDEACKKEFLYGGGETEPDLETEDEE